MPTVPPSLSPFALPTAAPAFSLPQSTATLSPERQSELANYALNAYKSPLAVHATWLTHIFAALFLISAVLLIVLLAVQTTKQESLGGSMSSRAEAYRPRLGVDGQLARITEGVAVSFVIFATIISLSGI